MKYTGSIAQRREIGHYIRTKYDYLGNPRRVRIASDGAVAVTVDQMPNANVGGRMFAGWDAEIYAELLRGE